MTCAFFGHRRVPNTLRTVLKEQICRLIEKEGFDEFLVGNHGDFDYMVRSVLRELCKIYSHIRYNVVLAYMPSKKTEYDDYSDTIYPDGLETVPKKFAIVHRNRWMVRQADRLIVYIDRDWGGAWEAAALANRQDKPIINLAEKRNLF